MSHIEMEGARRFAGRQECRDVPSHTEIEERKGASEAPFRIGET
jgi:hypothetical protein